jgi:UDP-N-acetylmuramate dehydrogenase
VLIETEVPLAPRTTLQLGGLARYFVGAKSEQDIADALEFARERALPVWVLGGGSNIVVPDAGLDGLVLALGTQGQLREDTPDGVRLAVDAGEKWDDFVRQTVELGLAGLECLSGIPGSVGATPIQNVGAYGQEVSDTLVAVRAFDREQRRFVEFTRDECEFGYRESRFKLREPGRYVVSRVSFELTRGVPAAPRYPELQRALGELPGPATARDLRHTVLQLRSRKSMLLDANDPNTRSCGSFFLNPVVTSQAADAVESRVGVNAMPRFPQRDGRVKLSAAWLIERSGFEKGFREGSVGISSRHALALVCHEGATSGELIALARRIQSEVLARTGVALTPEPLFW